MFGRKKMYKKGLADAMKAYEAFGKKQETALEKIVQDFKNSNKELDAKLKALGEDIIAVYDYLDKSEKAALYKLCTPMDLKELEESERRLLIAVLCQLADDEGSRYNSDQRKFVNSIRRYLEIPNVQTFADYSAIEEIDSLDIQETFMRVCLEFMYLQDADEMSDDQEAFFDNFAVSKRQAKLIEFDVIRQFHMFGAEGVAEKYGKAEVEIEEVANIADEVEEEIMPISRKPYVEVPLQLAEKIRSTKHNILIETSDFIIVGNTESESIFSRSSKNENSWTAFNKNTQEEKNITEAMSPDQNTTSFILKKSRIKGIYENNSLVYLFANTIYKYDIDNNTNVVICKDFNKENWDVSSIQCNCKWIVFKLQNKTEKMYKICIVNIANGSVLENMVDEGGKPIETHTYALVKDSIYLIDYRNGETITCADGGSLSKSLGIYNIIKQKLTRTTLSSLPIEEIFTINNEAYFYTGSLEGEPFVLNKIVQIDNEVKCVSCNEGNESYKFCFVNIYENYLVYSEDGGSYSVYVFDFDKQETHKVATDCYSGMKESTGLFSSKWSYYQSTLTIIGQWLYYSKSLSDFTTGSVKENFNAYRVNFNNPMDKVDITKR